jgi:type I restriction enzyme M protein
MSLFPKNRENTSPATRTVMGTHQANTEGLGLAMPPNLSRGETTTLAGQPWGYHLPVPDADTSPSERTRIDVDLCLTRLGFTLSETGGTFSAADGYQVIVALDVESLARSSINYGPAIVVHHGSTSSFRQSENLVVLQCVTDLLRRGYPASAIELEKGWPLGHKQSGRLDVFLKDPTGMPYAMIECKTAGAEYSRARNKTLEDGGQLFSYYAQQRDVRELYLYSCRPWAADLNVLAEAIPTVDLDGASVEELHKSWDRSFLPRGLFHPEAEPYDGSFRGLVKKDLHELDRNSGSGVFNSFAEILRHNVVSDKPNAFNKIFNLFLCKIADEDHKDDEQEVDFQWRHGDSGEALLARLQSLYTLGLKNYLGIVPEAEYQSPIAEFAFIDVFDKSTFEANLAILREVVELLQNYKIKYSARQQHLGDFFEMLLNSGVKQESGQFFTPTPLAHAILRSLPIGDIISAKVESKETYVLPYTIDFACGAGHFLTEAIGEIAFVAASTLPGRLTGTALSRFEAGQPSHYWAKDYMYGIEKDHRLAKVTKIATFLNGDGEANVAQGDGLGPFSSDSGYVGRLISPRPAEPLRRFDILVANPPFSVSNFRRDVESGADRFRLYKYLTAQSSEIECLFLERASQLLADNGVAGIIFPLSILSNSRTIYAAARRLLALDFSVVGLVELREKTFIATPTSTVCLFLRRRSLAAQLTAAADLINRSDEVVAALEAQSLDVATQATIDRIPNATPQVVLDAAYDDDILAHALRIILDGGADVVAAFSGESVKAQQRFLGYRFSRARGADGVHMLGDPDNIETKMFDPHRDGATDRLSTQLRLRFSGAPTSIPEPADSYMKAVSSDDLWQPGTWQIQNPSAFFVQEQTILSYNPLGDYLFDLDGSAETVGSWLDSNRCALIRGVTYPKAAETPDPTATKILTASNIDLRTRKLIEPAARYLRDATHVSPTKQPIPSDVVICMASGSLAHLGKIAVCDQASDAYIGGFLAILRCADPVDARILEANLLSTRFRRLIAGSKEQNISNLTEAKLRDVPLHVPSPADFVALHAKLLTVGGDVEPTD